MHETIRQYLVDNSPQSGSVDFSNDESLLEAGIIDSMSMVDLISFLEKEYSFQIDEDDMTPENFDSLDAIVDFVNQKKDG
ncbi:MAG: acyl carrier protein [Pirellulales bacterium]|nr:acyl carrier protein [Pirellulales bacterium]